jgi:L-fuculose-phosphate aldolase
MSSNDIWYVSLSARSSVCLGTARFEVRAQKKSVFASFSSEKEAKIRLYLGCAPAGMGKIIMNDAPTLDEAEARDSLVRAMRRMHASGLNRGTSGNASLRVPGGMVVTPSGVAPDELSADMMVFVSAAGAIGDGLRPSSEYQMHHAILAQRLDAGAVMHCHSRFATVLGCVGRPIAPIHYMILTAKTRHVGIAPYATFGTEALASAVVATMGEGNACLMANHGQVAIGATWQQALAIAEEVEEQAALTYFTAMLGGGHVLSDAQLDASEAQFRGYGQRPSRA